jgi:hypothetical protein
MTDTTSTTISPVYQAGGFITPDVSEGIASSVIRRILADLKSEQGPKCRS